MSQVDKWSGNAYCSRLEDAQKIRELKAMQRKAGFYSRPGKGSHTFWVHPALPEERFTFSGGDGDDAHHYQEKEVRRLLRMLKEVQHE